MNTVRELLERKRKDVEARKRVLPEIARPCKALPTRRRFHIFAEIKRLSLSAGSLRPGLDPARLAQAYEAAGASAISILTEEHYFGGSLNDLSIARPAVGIPLLQKDFIIDPFQIPEAKHYGADFVLLIARFLSRQQLEDFLQRCNDEHLQAIVEVTSEEEIEKVPASAKFIGVNSRDLNTLTIDTTKFARLRPKLPAGAFLLAESGIRRAEQIREIMQLGYHGALVGEHFLRCENPAGELERFVTATKTKVKVCGITNESDALAAIECGAAAVGFIFADSPRRIDPEKLQGFRARLPNHVLKVGVFKGQTAAEVHQWMRRFELDVAQVYDQITVHAHEVWKARMIHDEQDPLLFSPTSESLLWDIKCDPEKVWPRLKNVFALAGGLNPANVGRAIEVCKPQWIDVARGVESIPGRKDRKKLEDLMKEIP